MNITKNVILDLYPLYAEAECSADTRALVEEYLRTNPKQAEEFKRIMSARLPVAAPTAKSADSEEAQALRATRRRLRLRGWVLGFAIFFSLCPFSFWTDGVHSHLLLRDAPGTACLYAAVGAAFWVAFVVLHRRSRGF